MKVALPIDRVFEDWFAVNIPNAVMEKPLKIFHAQVPDFEILSANKYARDQQKTYQLTVITPPELESLVARNALPAPETYADKRFEIELRGIGTVKTSEAKIYFIACQSSQLTAFRKALGLSEDYTLHITLGFDPCDLYGIEKSNVVWPLL